MTSGRNSLRVRAGVVAAALLAVTLGPWAVALAEGGSLSVDASINGQSLAEADSGAPVVVEPIGQTDIVVRATNDSDQVVEVGRVRIAGRVLGLSVVGLDVSYDPTRIRPGQTVDLVVDGQDVFVSAEHQASGLLVGRLEVLSTEREVLGSQDFVLRVAGSPVSVLSVFTLVVAGLTVAGLIATLVAVSRRRLAPSRWRRAVRFGLIGLGAATALVMSLSLLGILAPTLGVAIPLVLIAVVLGGLVGWISPGPLSMEDEFDSIGGTVAFVPESGAPPGSVPQPPPYRGG